MPAKSSSSKKTTTTTRVRAKTTREKKPIKKSARAEQSSLPLEPMPVTADDMARWHLALARVAGRISLTLSRRRRPPDLIDDIVNTLAPVLEEARVRQ